MVPVTVNCDMLLGSEGAKGAFTTRTDNPYKQYSISSPAYFTYLPLSYFSPSTFFNRALMFPVVTFPYHVLPDS